MAQKRGAAPRKQNGTEKPAARAPETPLIPIAQSSEPAAPRNRGAANAPKPGKSGPGAGRTQAKGKTKARTKAGDGRTPPKKAPAPPARKAAGNTGREQPRPSAGRRRARTISYGEALRRRRRNKILAGAVITAVLAVGLFASFRVIFQVNTISVTGETPYTAEQVVKILPFAEGDSMFSVRDEKISQTLTSQLPYIESVNVLRRLPDSVEIQLTAAQEKYYINSISGWVVLSESFKILRVTMEQPQGLVLISGAEADNPVQGEQVVLTDADKQEALESLLASLRSTEFPDVSGINVESVYEMSVQYGSVRVLVGTVNELDAKLDWAKYLLTDMQVQGEQSGTLDVSTRNSEGRLTGHWLPD